MAIMIMNHRYMQESDKGIPIRKQNVKKNQKSRGKGTQRRMDLYNDARRKIREAKLPKPVTCNCRYKCREHFSESERLEICKNFWAIDDFGMQKKYMLKHIIVKPVARRVMNIPVEKQRASTREYRFYKGENFITVCKTFFTTTLAISSKPIETAIKYIDEVGSFEGNDNRGKRRPHIRSSEAKAKEVKEHIEKFLMKRSQSRRKDTSQQTRNRKLNICKMYSLYRQKMVKNNKVPVLFNVYKTIFETEYNLQNFYT